MGKSYKENPWKYRNPKKPSNQRNKSGKPQKTYKSKYGIDDYQPDDFRDW